MVHHLQTILLAGLAMGTSPSPEPSAAAVTCVTTVTFSSTINSQNQISITATTNLNSTPITCGTSCTFGPASASGNVTIVLDTNNDQFAYLWSGDSTFVTSETVTMPATGSYQSSFSVAGAQNGRIFTHDPRITVNTGTCSTSI